MALATGPFSTVKVRVKVRVSPILARGAGPPSSSGMSGSSWTPSVLPATSLEIVTGRQP
jgi:hypothetical protein